MRGSEIIANRLRIRKQLIILCSSKTILSQHNSQCIDCFPQDASTCASAIQWCGETHALSLGHIIYDHILCHSYIHGHVHMESLLMNMYVKCGSIQDAICIFHHMHHPCVFAFNYTIKIYANQGKEEKAFALFNQMSECGVSPNQVTYTAILSMLFKIKDGVQVGKKLHVYIRFYGSFNNDVILGTSLLNMYGKCDRLCDAEKVFDAMIEKNLVTWTTLISLYTYHGERNRAFQAFSLLFLQGLLPNRVSFLTMLSACKDPMCLADGKRIHATIVCNEAQQDISIMNALVNMYGKCGTIEETRRFFDAMHTYDIISYSSMIGFYSQQHNIREVIMLSEGMQIYEITPNDVTYINILGAFSGHEVLKDARLVHIQIQCYGYEVHMSVANAIIAMYGRCWSLEDASKVFEKILYKDAASWNSIIGAHVEQGQIEIALRLFEDMQNKKGIFPDVFTFISLLKACTASLASENAMLLHVCICEDGLEHSLDISTSLINAYSKCNSLQDAQKVFDRMVKHTKISWNSIIGAYVCHGKHEVAHRLLFRMIDEEGKIPDKVTIVSILGAFVKSEALFEGKELHKFLLDHGYTIDEVMGSSLINMYGKCGDIGSAKDVFDNVKEEATVVSWTSMIRVYVEHDQGEKALQLFSQMIAEKRHLIPDDVAFITILAACANQSALDDGKCVHACILEWGLDSVIDVSNAIVNMYGKCGCVKSAWMMFNTLHDHDICSWNSLLAVYAQHGFGKEVIHLVSIMEERHVRPDKFTFTIVLSACSHGGLIHEGCKFFTRMIEVCYTNMHPCEDHAVCMIDLLGRAGLLDVARQLVLHHLPFQPTVVAYTTLLGACQLDEGVVVQGFCLAKYIIELKPQTSASYIILSNMYSLMESISCKDGICSTAKYHAII